MKKMNKKGFTLIEMLVVIAIIAVLVSIIIPTVSSATGKAQAAADAANLRSMLAEATTDYLNGQSETTAPIGLVKLTVTAASGNTPASYDFEPTDDAPVAKSKAIAGTPATITEDDGVLTAKFGSYELKHFAYVAENGGSLDDAVSALGETGGGNTDATTPTT